MGGQKVYQGQVGRSDVRHFDPEQLIIATDPVHPLYDPRALEEPDEAFVFNVRAHGILQPIVVWVDGDRAYVVAGRKRTMAARQLKKLGVEITVPATIRKGNHAELVEMLVSENEARVNDRPSVRATKMRRLVDLGRSEERIAQVFATTVNNVRATLSLLDCAPAVVKAVDEGFSLTYAAKLASKPRAEQEKILGEMQAKGTTRGRAASQAASGKQIATDVPRMRSRAVIERAEKQLRAEDQSGYADLLKWVLGWEADMPTSKLDKILTEAATSKRGKSETADE